jgi:hypothetical protein
MAKTERLQLRVETEIIELLDLLVEDLDRDDRSGTVRFLIREKCRERGIALPTAGKKKRRAPGS